MTDLNKMNQFLKKEDVKSGDLLEFTDEGEIKQVDFSKAKDGSDMKNVFQIGVKLPDGQKKIVTVNKTSQNALKSSYGKETKDWIGKKAKVNFVSQLSFGKMTDILVLTGV